MSGDILLLLILLVLSGFFSASETSLFSIGQAKARYLAKEPGAANQLILKMKGDPHKLLTTILIGNNLVNIGASALATAVSINYFTQTEALDSSGMAVGIATGIMTFLILVFGEIFPKSVAARNNVMIARFVIFPLY